MSGVTDQERAYEYRSYLSASESPWLSPSSLAPGSCFKQGLPCLDRVEFKIMKDGVIRATALRAGEVDFANYVPREYVERLSKDPTQVIIGMHASTSCWTSWRRRRILPHTPAWALSSSAM